MSDRPHGERLQKALAEAGLGSRREIEGWIRAGRLSVNGRIAALGVRVRPQDDVRLDGRPLRQRAARTPAVFLCHRSPGDDLREPRPSRDPMAAADAGRIERDPRAPMASRLPRRSGRRYLAVSPMPRVDGGLEILTSDGTIALALQRSVRQQIMRFGVRVKGLLGPQQLSGIRSGELDSPPALEVLELEAPPGNEGDESRSANHWYQVSARGASGKEIRQLFERQGAVVSRILRTAFGGVALDRTVSRGQFRPATDSELAALGVTFAARPPRTVSGQPRAKFAARRNSGRSRRD